MEILSSPLGLQNLCRMKVKPEKIPYEEHLKFLQTKLPHLKYKDWFINQEYIPEEDDENYDEFWQQEEERCKLGFFMDNDFYISGFLYWHLNFWKTEITKPDEYGGTFEEYTNPSFRDNELIISDSISRAKHYQKGLAIGGSRRIAKSVTISSYLCHNATLDRHSQNLFVGLNGDDIDVTNGKIKKGLSELPLYFQWMLVKQDWDKEVNLGVKDTKGNKKVFSTIYIRNIESGKKEEAIAGTKPRCFVIEEGGKGRFLKGFKAAVPGFTSPYGWVCSPLIIFTGGDMENYHDAKNVFMNPRSHNFLEFTCPLGKVNHHGEVRKHGLFLGNKYRQEAKHQTTLGDYLGLEDRSSDLFNIPFWVSDEEWADQILEEELYNLLQNPDKELYYKEQMYFPKTVDDIFLNVGTNIYNSKAAIAQQTRIAEMGITGMPVKLFSDGEKICWEEDTKREYIREWPLETQKKDAPVMIYELPEPNPPKFLYVAGIDPYRQDTSTTSQSLGAVYIYKRMHSLTGSGMSDGFVASYVGRPDSQAEWEETTRMLLMMYNAYALVENDEYSFCKYMVTKQCAEMYLSPQPNFYKTLVLNGTQKRDWGVSRQSTKVRNYLFGTLKKYLEESLYREIDDNGVVQKEVLGVSRILDHTLLTEISGFTEVANVDRIVAASLAIAMAHELDPMLGTVVGEKSNDRAKEFQKAFNNIKKKTFSGGSSSFSGKSFKTFKR